MLRLPQKRTVQSARQKMKHHLQKRRPDWKRHHNLLIFTPSCLLDMICAHLYGPVCSTPCALGIMDPYHTPLTYSVSPAFPVKCYPPSYHHLQNDVVPVSAQMDQIKPKGSKGLPDPQVARHCLRGHSSCLYSGRRPLTLGRLNQSKTHTDY